MIRGLKFTLEGDAAHFKSPTSNVKIAITYPHIPKPALLGILGNILGLKGYKGRTGKGHPEFYEELKDFEISIVPATPRFKIMKLSRSDTTGASNIGVFRNTEQVLVNPSWDIFILENESSHYLNLKERLENNDYCYDPIYLGKRDYFAYIENVEEVLFEDIDMCYNIDSLIIEKEVNIRKSFMDGNLNLLSYRIPYKLDSTLDSYEMENFIITDRKLNTDYEKIYSYGDLNLMFI